MIRARGDEPRDEVVQLRGRIAGLEAALSVLFHELPQDQRQRFLDRLPAGSPLSRVLRMGGT